VTSSYFKKWNWSWKDTGLISLRRSRPNRRDCLTLAEKDFQEAFLKWRRRWDRCLRAGGNYFEVDGHTCHSAPMPRLCYVTTMPFSKRLLKATAQRGMNMAWHVWIIIGRPETACGRPALIRLLPASTRSSTKVVIWSIQIR
jgi:hypothetical protein